MTAATPPESRHSQDQSLLHNHATHPEAFPRLTDAQLTELVRFATVRECVADEVLFNQGDTNSGVYVVDRGKLEIYEPGVGGDRIIATHTRGEFTGELGMMRGAPAIASCRALGPACVLYIPGDALQKVVTEIPKVGDVFLRSWMLRREILEDRGFSTVQLIGSRWSARTFELRDFLGRHGVLFKWTDPETDHEADAILQQFCITPAELPVLVCGQAGLIRNPDLIQLAEHLGLRTSVNAQLFDLVVVGGGPGGLAAAVYGASEGLRTLVVESRAPGGQAGTSSRIENYLGFPLGLSGGDLADRATIQARRFGATLNSPSSVTSLSCDGVHKLLTLEDGQQVAAKAVVIATGARYRNLPAEGVDRFEQHGVYYGATHLEAIGCKDADVVIVGGGNSAGQAAVFLSEHARKVTVVIRGGSLKQSMSRYLIDRIEHTPNIHLLPNTNIAAAHGGEWLERVTLRDGAGQRTDVPCQGLFVMIGAEPNTGWINGCIGLDAHGFIVTGSDAKAHPLHATMWDEPRDPFYLETTRPGVFAVGDVRAGSVKRVASAVGEGSMCVKYVHEAITS